MAAFDSYWVPIILLGLIMAAAGGSYGAVIANVNQDNYNNLKSTFQTVIIVAIVFVALFAILSLYYVTAQPSVFPKFAVLVMSSSLLLSLLSVSFSVLQVTSQ